MFLGASYFRAVAKGQLYGLSARGLAINTGEAKGEEFPFFKAFWIEKPAAGANSIVVHALLDSDSAAAPIASPSAPATPPCSMSKWRSIHGWIWNTPVSRR